MATNNPTETPLFPAWAGVILVVTVVPICVQTFPRMGGGDPKGYKVFKKPKRLFPAWAGVILSSAKDVIN